MCGFTFYLPLHFLFARRHIKIKSKENGGNSEISKKTGNFKGVWYLYMLEFIINHDKMSLQTSYPENEIIPAIHI